jgi:type 1 fimbriae regulatory protein FimB/type 1 fimbriae regulatory protein FimE
MDKLIEAAKGNRWGHRDATAILLAYRHGLRASELVALRWDDIDFSTSKLHVRRAKGGTASVHPLRAKELRALRRLLRETPEGQRATYLFVSERMAPLSVEGYQRMVARAGKAARLRVLVHSHMLRHSTVTQLKVVMVALVCATLVVGIGLAASVSAGGLEKPGKPVTAAVGEPRTIR